MSDILNRIDEAARRIEALAGGRPALAIVLGSGLGDALDFMTVERRVPYADTGVDPAAQLAKNTTEEVLSHGDLLLSYEYASIGGHPGYIDDELLSLTTLSLERCRDAAMCMSPKILSWVKENHIELITYYDLMKEQ